MRPVRRHVRVEEVGLESLPLVAKWHRRFYVDTGRYEAVFSDYVAESVDTFRARYDPRRDRLWAELEEEEDERVVGFIGAAHRDDGWVQLRWLWVDANHRGGGLGAALVDKVVAFARDQGVPGVMLWTMSDLDAARRIYEAAGFKLVAEEPAPWHARLVQQRFELRL